MSGQKCFSLASCQLQRYKIFKRIPNFQQDFCKKNVNFLSILQFFNSHFSFLIPKVGVRQVSGRCFANTYLCRNAVCIGFSAILRQVVGVFSENLFLRGRTSQRNGTSWVEKWHFSGIKVPLSLARSGTSLQARARMTCFVSLNTIIVTCKYMVYES